MPAQITVGGYEQAAKINNAAGTITFGAYSIGTTPAGPDGDGVLAVFTLRALAAGSGSLSLDHVVISDRTGSTQNVSRTYPAAVTVRPAWKVFIPLIIR